MHIKKYRLRYKLIEKRQLTRGYNELCVVLKSIHEYLRYNNLEKIEVEYLKTRKNILKWKRDIYGT